MSKRKHFSKALTILLAVVMICTMMPSMAWADGGGSGVSPEAGQGQAPTSVTVQYEGLPVLDGKIIAKQGDKFNLKAYDQNGQETPVTWQTSSTSFCTVDENGEVTITASLSSGGTSYLYFTAISTIDSSIKSASTKVEATGYRISDYGTSVTLSGDGQNITTARVSGGVSGYNQWTFDEKAAKDIASVSGEVGNGSSIQFNCYRPGSFNVSVKVNGNKELVDTKTVSIKGVAVETEAGERTKTYLSMSENGENPSVQLAAFFEAEKSLSAWRSSNEQVATVDESGKVTAQGIGTALISAEDNAGGKGGIKVVVESSEIPYFEGLEFSTTALESGAWKAGETFSPTKTSYKLPIKNYSTSALALQKGTLYNTDKYKAEAVYTDIDGKEQKVSINSGSVTTLSGMPFDSSILKIIISDKTNADNKTEYIFNVTRPRDTTKTIKSKGIVLSPAGRSLMATKYNGQPEGTMLKADEDGNLSSGIGVSGSVYYYRTYALDRLKSFKLNLTGNTAYTHIRYSVDEGKTWKEIAQGGGTTDEISFPERNGSANPVVKTRIQILDDESYSDNVKEGRDGFEVSGDEVTEYILWTEQIGDVTAGAQITEASTDSGDWYPSFSPDLYTYSIVVPNGTASLELKYKAAENAEVKLGSNLQQADESGYYTLSLKTSAQTLNVTSQNGVTNTYSFKIQAKSKYDVPDKVVDYLCINSQYTNGGFGIQPETTLSGSFKSLGNFGGYITYYYENGLTDNPNNPYGVDFYVYGNSFADGGSAAESGQVWVSENGNKWYALAGSEHYENSTIWDYEVTYAKTENGKTAWTDNQGNSNDGRVRAGAWPNVSNYYMNDLVNSEEIKLSGILLPCIDGSIMGDHSTASFVDQTKFGYVDYYANGTIGASVNPYMENPTKSNGFDLMWAVDEDGNPVDVEYKEFHYVKIVTASNIWAGSFNEKSTEVTQVIRASANENEVGVTSLPETITISDGAGTKTISLKQGKQVYEADLGDMKYVSISVNGASEDANIYVNNVRIGANDSADGIKVTKEIGKKLVRVIVQEGEKEPQIILLKLTSSAKESNELIEGVKINVSGSGRNASTKDGKVYTATVGHKIEKIGIVPVIDSSVTYTINGMAAKAEYDLTYGENTFEITASDGNGKNQTISLKVTREDAPPVSENKIQVYFVLYGDELHGDNGMLHTYQNDRSSLKIWASNRAYEVPEGSTVLDVFEKAMKANNLTYVNSGGNYISSINGLSEFSNGPLSGWMYLLNGSHPSSGVAEQIVKNGDRIVFHYTDDYTKEEGSEAWGKPFETEKEVTTSGSSGTATTTAPTEVTVSGSTATATVKSENAAETIKQAKENKSAEIVLNVAASDTKGAETVKVQLDTATVKSFINDTQAALTVKTENGQVSLDREALKTVASEAKGATITLEVVKVTNPTEVQKKAAGTNGYVIRLVVKSGDKIISDFNKGKATVTVEIPSKLKDKKVAVIHIADDGKIEQLSGKTVKIGGKDYYTFETPHFSAFALVDADELGLEAGDEEANIEKIKELVSDMSLKASSSKTSKKNIKVTLTVDKSTAAAIKEIREKGYTVKYKYYRSTNKASKYQAKITKTTKSFTNIAGKKGTKYYYKARIQVYDKDGKLVAQTALNQCKYAARTWIK